MSQWLIRAGDLSIMAIRMRILLAIALLLQSLGPLALAQGVEAPLSGGPCECAATCCCGGAAVSHCATGPVAVCMCNTEPDVPERAPAPLPRDGQELTPVLAPSPIGVVAALPEPTSSVMRAAAAIRPHLSHNEIQALLGVWRT